MPVLLAKIGIHCAKSFLLPPFQAINLLRYGKAAKHAFGRSLADQARDIFKLFCASTLEPAQYYRGGLARYGGKQKMFRFIPFSLYVENLRVCNRDYARRMGYNLNMRDKRSVERECRKLGLAHAKTVVSVENDGTIRDAYGKCDGTLPPIDLFVKPAMGRQGKGAELWIHRDGSYIKKGGRKRLSGKQLIARIANKARRIRRAMLVQEALSNHPDLEKIAGQPTATVRIATMFNGNHVPEIVFSIVTMAADAENPVVNFHTGGISHPIDPHTGTLGSGMGIGFARSPRFVQTSGVTGEAVAGRKMPLWNQSRDFALRLHRLLECHYIMAWDIATTRDGPVLMEAGLEPGTHAVNMSFMGGFLGSRLSQLLTRRVYHVLQETEPDSSRWRFDTCDLEQWRA